MSKMAHATGIESIWAMVKRGCSETCRILSPKYRPRCATGRSNWPSIFGGGILGELRAAIATPLCQRPSRKGHTQ